MEPLRVSPRLERLARVAAMAVVALGATVLAGWLLGVSRLRGPIPGLIEMKANTAVGFVLAGASLWLLTRRDIDRRLRRVAYAFAGAVFLIGAVSLAEYLLGRGLGIDQLLFHDSPEGPADPTVSPGRLAPQTAVGFILAALALTTLDSGRRRCVVGETLALVGAAVGLFALLGYAYGSGDLQAVAALQPIAVHTAAGLMVLCIGILLARSERGAVATLRGDGPGSLVARRLLPVAFVALPLVGWLPVVGEQGGHYDSETGVALLIVAFLAMLTAGTLATSRKLNLLEQARRESELTARAGQKMLRAIVDNTTSVIYVKDTESRYLLVNRRFEELFGVTDEDAAGKTPEDLFTAETAAALRANDSRVIESGTVLEFEEELPAGSGPNTYISVKFPLRAGEEVWGLAGISTDITERKRAEETAERARSEAEQANRAKSEFLSRMSHELRTPLAAVIGFGQLLELSKLDQRQRESVRQILNGGNHLLDLINELVDISRIESGGLAISIEPVNVASVVDEALMLIEPLATARSIRVRADHEPAAGAHVLADRQRLKQILINLLSNAVKYNLEGGLVTVGLGSCGDGRLKLIVTDTGPGIEKAKLPKLFVPFERLGAEATGIEGTGLGLTISKGLAEAMGGSISVESEVGRGTSFAIELERAEEPAQRRDERASAGSPGEGLAGLGRRTILYVEDNDANFLLVERTFEDRPEITLLWAKDGRTGLEIAAESRPDLVLLDLHLPDMDGTELLARLRRSPGTRGIPVIVVSADITRTRSELLIKAGAEASLTKPLELDRFLDTVFEVLGSRRPRSRAA